ncbi:MAG: hypothetical protein ACLTKG_00365 [Collinsella intestinalis]
MKPQNIMVLPDGNIKVMDFGIARQEQPSHQDNNVLGTPTTSPRADPRPGPGRHERHLLPRRGHAGAPPAACPSMATMPSPWLSSRSTRLPIPPSQVNPGVDRARAHHPQVHGEDPPTASRPPTSCARCSTPMPPVARSTWRAHARDCRPHGRRRCRRPA